MNMSKFMTKYYSDCPSWFLSLGKIFIFVLQMVHHVIKVKKKKKEISLLASKIVKKKGYKSENKIFWQMLWQQEFSLRQENEILRKKREKDKGFNDLDLSLSTIITGQLYHDEDNQGSDVQVDTHV